MIAFLSYLTQILMAVMMATWMAALIPRAAVCADRIQEVLDTDTSVVISPTAVNEVPSRGVVEMRNVAFAYPGAEEPVVSGVTFTSLPGQTTAIVGSTGSGKTTLINLVPRLFDATEGRVLVDGVDVRDLAARGAVGPHRPRAPEAVPLLGDSGEQPAVRQARRDRGADVGSARDRPSPRLRRRRCPAGSRPSISQGGTNVSGGQRQRLAIARAVVRRPEIYLFDDSFSALDLATDARLRAALAPHLASSTVLVVAQRISTILTADQILVLDDGVPSASARTASCSRPVPPTRRSSRRR